MSVRIPLTVAVVGALIVGGATTGATLASWQDKAAMAHKSIKAGTFDLDINGGGKTTAISLGTLPQLPLNSGATPGDARTISPILNYTATGENNNMVIDLTAVSVNQNDLMAGLEVAASAVGAATACPTPSPSAYKKLDTYSTTTVATAANITGSVKLCLSFRVGGGASSAVGGKAGTVSLTVRATQVRP